MYKSLEQLESEFSTLRNNIKTLHDEIERKKNYVSQQQLREYNKRYRKLCREKNELIIKIETHKNYKINQPKLK